MGSYRQLPDRVPPGEPGDTGKVYIVDDDPLILTTLENILWAEGIACIKFLSAEQLLLNVNQASRGCVLTDFRLPGLNGVELQEDLVQKGYPLPVIVMTGFADVDLAVRAIKAGALDILQKPFKTEQLLRQVRAALVIAQDMHARSSEREAVQRQVDNLSSRELAVLWDVIAGLSNKEIAQKLGLSPRTVESHRARVMEKMEVENLPALILKASAVREPHTAKGPLSNER